jgi:hypothetical protein
MRVVRIVDEMMVELNREDRHVGKEEPQQEFIPPAAPPDEAPSVMTAAPDADPFANVDPPPPPKRRRGRPRKTQPDEKGIYLVTPRKNWNDTSM